MDQHHVNVTSSNISCGVLELSRIESDVDKVLYAIAAYLYHPSRGTPAAFLIWSDLKESNGSSLAEKLAAAFGYMTASPLVENPKTSNNIRVWIWEIQHEKFKEWYRKERVKKAQKL